MIKTTTFVCQLPLEVQSKIEEAIVTFCKQNNYDNVEEILENAMEGRLCDLEENIDIESILMGLITS
jgi:hypothetical protein